MITSSPFERLLRTGKGVRRQEAATIALLAYVLRMGIEAGAIRAVAPELVAYLMFHLGNVLVIRELSGRRDFPLKKVLDAMDDLIDLGLVTEE